MSAAGKRPKDVFFMTEAVSSVTRYCNTAILHDSLWRGFYWLERLVLLRGRSCVFLPEILGEKFPLALEVRLGDLPTPEGLYFGLLTIVVPAGIIYEALLLLSHWRLPSLGHSCLDAITVAAPGDDLVSSSDCCLGDHLLCLLLSDSQARCFSRISSNVMPLTTSSWTLAGIRFASTW